MGRLSPYGAGTVHALLGENGAGKTTLMRIAYGMERADHGVIRVGGRTVRFRTPADALASGVGMVHQHFTLVPAMTVAENVALGRRGTFDSRSVAAEVRRMSQEVGLDIDPNAHVGDLSVNAQQRLELLKVLSRNVEILILDEPTAVLAPSETDDLLGRLRQLADAGRAVILITHKLREALSIADDLTVLRHGITTLSKSRDLVDERQLVVAMLGQREPRALMANVTRSFGAAVISAHTISIKDVRGVVRIREASFVVRAGEIIGIAGVEGSGHHELLRAIAGRAAIDGGVLELPASIGFVPDDRHRDGLILEMSLVENLALSGAAVRRGIVRWNEMAFTTREILRDFDVRAESEHVLAGTLSGGNQQKLILGRELRESPPALVVQNPTRGLDIGASAYVEDRLLDAASHGVSVVVHSTDLDEILSIADRMLVVYSGTVREVPVDRDAVGRAMLGAA